MNARAQTSLEQATSDYFVFGSMSAERSQWLQHALGPLGVTESASLELSVLLQRIAIINPSLVFIDFSGDGLSKATEAVAAVRQSFEMLPIVAVGLASEGGGALAALRAGVRNFIDIQSPVEDAENIVGELLANLSRTPVRHGKLTVLLGARVGVGVSTLATNLALMTHRRERRINKQAILIDLGLPIADDLLYLNSQADFHFVSAVRNLRRFDQTFVHTAISRHSGGLALLPLPPDLSEMREISYSGAIGLLGRLRSFFDNQLIDLGGFTNLDFIAQMVRAADESWLVCDQNVASVVSAVELLDALKEREVDLETLQLLVNKYDSRLGLGADQIAKQVKLPLLGLLPDRRQLISRAANQGTTLAETMPRDPYIRSLEPLLARLMSGNPASSPAPSKERVSLLSQIGRLVAKKRG
ncbi:hypothetical protein QU481_19890 [Crenobacter sp. SG2303]|uniref:Fimbrial protein n=1 Tax=Crenobacter oryzisoli TaxID=3056844 RepID=A0ABT7XTJ2_9NEIS|nr:hypothetical protein [Crenobacter sp. SG2303]MDN0077111.1 hypothetical protein [Crenobacter sp. SG2303]